LVHRDIADAFLPLLNAELLAKKVHLKGDAEAKKVLPHIDNASSEDWRTEYLDLILSIKVVDSLQAAIDHINYYGSGHTDAIVTDNTESARAFQSLVDSAAVMVNCSTRFSDGFRFGMGAEVGISTNKIHARGPVGLDGLMIYKYLLNGNGQIVAQYSGPGGRTFKHEKLK
jgi:glutamate-5-semialdehyde dehydrogenase